MDHSREAPGKVLPLKLTRKLLSQFLVNTPKPFGNVSEVHVNEYVL